MMRILSWNVNGIRVPAVMGARNRAHWAWACLLVLGCLYVGLADTSLRGKSVTVDEFLHLPAGLNLLSTGDMRYSSMNPPLMNGLSALPLWCSGLELWFPDDGPTEKRHNIWINGYLFMDQHHADYHQQFVRSRRVTVALIGLLGLMAFLWGRLLVPERSEVAGLLAAGLVWLSPNVIAHARLVTTDAGTMAFMMLAVFVLWLFVRRPGWLLALLCGATLGAAQIVKFTAVYLYASHALTLAIALALRRDLRTRRIAVQVVAAFAVSLLVINAGYGFQRTMKPLGDFAFQSAPLLSLSQSVPAAFPVPLPESYLLAFDQQLADVAAGDPSFLFGASYKGGKWYYFLAVLAVKVPIPSMILLLLALYAATRARRAHGLDSATIMLPAALVFIMFSCFSNKQLGLRLVLPTLGFLWLWTGTMLCRVGWSRRMNVVIGVLAAWLVVESVRVHPDYLPYFNQFAGGPGRGHHYATDSNLDWGQDLPALDRWMSENDVPRIQLLYFGRVDPAIYGIDYKVPLDGVSEGYLAVSRSLYARSYVLYDHGRVVPGGPFRVQPMPDLEPVATVGNSIDIYRLDREENVGIPSTP